jgi:ribosome biogenesis GTPase
MALSLTRLGWNDAWQAAFAALGELEGAPGRIVSEHQHVYRVATRDGEYLAVVSGRFRHQAVGRHAYPAVGDWVVVERAVGATRGVIHAVLPRQSRFSRKVAGEVAEEQVVAANIDIVFLVSGLDDDFNLNRLLRYLVLVREGGATPVVVLNKADLCADLPGHLAAVRAVAPEVRAHAMSCRTGAGLDALQPYLAPAATVALLGSSGAGKSTIINRLEGRDVRRTREVRARDSRGRHTTSHRELVVLESGALLIDTPGMRELQLWEGSEGFGDAFKEVDALAATCHFRDCRHGGEPRCAVQAAVDEGRLSRVLLAQYRTLREEIASAAARRDARAQADQRRRGRSGALAMRRHRPRDPR